MYLKSRVMDEKLSNMTQRSSFPTPIIPPILVRSVTGVICQSDMVCSTILSKATDIPNSFFSPTTPVASTLYLKNSIVYISSFLTGYLIDWHGTKQSPVDANPCIMLSTITFLIKHNHNFPHLLYTT